MKKQFLCLVLLGLLGSVGNAWADENIFSAVPIATSDVKNKQIDATAFTASQATIEGGTMYMLNTENNERTFISTSAGPTGDKRKAFQIAANKQFYKIVLSSGALAAGDIISVDIYNSNSLWFSTATSRPGSAPTAKITGSTGSIWNNNSSYTVEEGDGICGQSTFYIYRNSNTTSFTNFQITRPAADLRPDAPISWSSASAIAVIGQSNSFPSLSNAESLSVAYASSNTSVATINASTGVIALVAKGETTISATYTTTGPSDTYKTTKVSYTLTVSNISAVSEKFWKFSDAVWSSYTQSASSQTIDNMYIVSNNASDLPVQDCSESYSDESLNFTKQLYTSGSSTESRRVLNICVAPKSKVSVYAAASGTGSRNLYISNGSYNNTSDQSTQATSSTTIFKLSHANVAGGDVFIHNTNGYYIYGIKVEPLKCGTPTFDHAGGTIDEGGSIVVTSENATSIKYAWTASGVSTPDSWTTAVATEDAISVTIPSAAENTPRLHAYGIRDGYNDGDAYSVTYTIVAPRTETSMAFVSPTAIMEIEESVTNVPTLTPAAANVGAVFTYTSSDEEIATVDENTGEVTAVSAGVVRITATYEGDATYSGSTAYYDIKVLVSPVNNKVWNSNDWDAQTFTSTSYIDNMEFVATSEKNIQITTGSASSHSDFANGFTKRVRTFGPANATSRYLHFRVRPNTIIIAYASGRVGR